MPATQAQIGYGFIFSFSATLGGAYTPIGAIEDFKPGKNTVAKVEIAANDSPDLYGEKIPGWRDVSDYEVKVVYDKTQRAVLQSLIGVVKFWKFIRPDATASTPFQAFMSELGDEVPVKEKMMTEFKLTVSGAQVLS